MGGRKGWIVCAEILAPSPFTFQLKTKPKGRKDGPSFLCVRFSPRTLSKVFEGWKSFVLLQESCLVRKKCKTFLRNNARDSSTSCGREEERNKIRKGPPTKQRSNPVMMAVYFRYSLVWMFFFLYHAQYIKEGKTKKRNNKESAAHPTRPRELGSRSSGG